MKLTYKITIPVFLGLILVIFLVALLSRHFLEKALLQEAFLRRYEAVLKHAPKFLKAEYFSEPFTPPAQGGFKRLSEEVGTASMARFTVWSKDGVILFSDLKSVIGFSSPNRQELKRLFSEEKPFFIVRQRDANQPVQSEVGEFLDIYIPIRLSREIVGAIQMHSVLAAVLSPVERQIRYTTYVLIVSAILILAVVYFLANHLRGEIDRNRELYECTKEQAVELERANKVKDEFLSLVSHELRTPLNVVMGYTGMIKDRMLGEINPEQEKALEKVISRGRDQLTMISSILEATQLEAEGGRVERREVSLKEFLDDLRSSYSIPLGKELSVIWDYPPDLPVVHTDGEKLKHVLQNLINNAIKFTEEGNVTISARYLNGSRVGESTRQKGDGDSQNGVVELKVSDTGVGIEKEHFPIVFERFRQVDSSETRRYGGVGIGLYIVKKFTELLGGKVEVESEPGKGSTFTVTIPLADEIQPGAESNGEEAVVRCHRTPE